MSTEDEIVILTIARRYTATANQQVVVKVPAGATAEERTALLRATVLESAPAWREVVRESLMEGAEIDGAIVEYSEGAPRIARGVTHQIVTHERADDCIDVPEVPGVPEYAWRIINGSRWAADGACAIREGAPVPALSPNGYWQPGQHTLIEGIIPARPSGIRHHGVFHERFADVLRAGDVMRDADDEFSPASVWRDGEVVAVVMPLRRLVWDPADAEGAVDADGNPASVWGADHG